jgi:hypothetical protein
MKVRLSLLACAMLVAACGGSATTSGSVPPGPLSAAASAEPGKNPQHVYWTLFAGQYYPEVQIAKVPLRAKSKVTNIGGNSGNTLNYASGMHVDSTGRLWILVFGTYSGDPGSVSVFDLPLQPTSLPKLTFVLSGTSDPDHLTFDPLGNLWVTSHNNDSVLEYTGPFKTSGKLSPATTLTDGITQPAGIAFDKHGNLYVGVQSSGTKSIAVFPKPISNKQPLYLDGLDGEGGLIFDARGNLYASSDGNPTAIVRYNSNDLANGDKPSIVDSTGLPDQAYESDFSLSATGNLYFANCGTNSSIFVYPTSTKAFSSKLAPSVDYTNPDITGAGCAWGIAIK